MPHQSYSILIKAKKGSSRDDMYVIYVKFGNKKISMTNLFFKWNISQFLHVCILATYNVKISSINICHEFDAYPYLPYSPDSLVTEFVLNAEISKQKSDLA